MDETITPPEWVTEDPTAADLWQRLAASVTVPDADLFEQFISYADEIRNAITRLARDGVIYPPNEGVKIHLAVRLLGEHIARLYQVEKRLGLNQPTAEEDRKNRELVKRLFKTPGKVRK